MKKILIFILVFAFLLSGCGKEPEEIVPEVPEISEVSESESSKPLPEEEPKEEPPEKIQTEIPETDYVWENFIEQMAKNGYTREEIESLETLGFSREEITAMTWVDVVRGLGMVQFGFEREEVESALEILKNPDLMDETFVAVGDSTTRIELIEEFVSTVEKGKAAFVHGTAVSEPLYLYFELSYEPGGMIEYTMISEHMVKRQKFTEIYLNEAFSEFKNKDGESFIVSKIDKYPGEQLKYSPEKDVPGMPVTLAKAKEKATEIMFKSCLANDEYDYTEEYLETLEPICEGIFDIAGKPYYCIGFYENGNHMGVTYYICAKESKVVFESSMVDGGLIPFEYPAEPKIVLEKD